MNIELLDPLCTMVKLIQLNFYDNTKLSIHEHIVTLQPKTQYQFITRYLHGDSRNNIGNLYYVIIRLIKWFIVESSENIIGSNNDNILNDQFEKNSDDLIESDEDVKHDDTTKSSSIKSTDSGNFIDKYLAKKQDKPSNNKFNQTNQQIISNNHKFRKLAEYFIAALKKLQLTYKEGLVVLSLQFYINCITSALNGTFVDDLIPSTLNDGEYEPTNLLDYNKIKNFWDVKDIEYIHGLYEDCFLLQADQSLTADAKLTCITGKIKKIDSILQMNEGKFKALIENNNKG